MASSGIGIGLRMGRPRPTALTAPRGRIYRALVEAVGRASPSSQVDPSQTAFALAELEAGYATALEPTRRAIDAVLDGLEREGFARLDAGRRVALLRSLAADAGPSRGDLAARALALAAAPFHPPGDEFHPTPVLL